MRIVKLITLGFILLRLNTAHADIYDVPPAQTVMKKKYSLGHEVALQLGYLPVGALSKYLAFGLSYALPFNDNHGWEVVNAMATSEIKTSLKTQLTAPFPDGYGVDASQVGTMTYLVTTNYLFSPLYTKSLLFNSSMVYHQLSLLGGGGLAGFSTGSVPVIDLGLMETFFLSAQSSIKFDFRYLNFFANNETIKNNISLVAAYGFKF